MSITLDLSGLDYGVYGRPVFQNPASGSIDLSGLDYGIYGRPYFVSLVASGTPVGTAHRIFGSAYGQGLSSANARGRSRSAMNVQATGSAGLDAYKASTLHGAVAAQGSSSNAGRRSTRLSASSIALGLSSSAPTVDFNINSESNSEGRTEAQAVLQSIARGETFSVGSSNANSSQNLRSHGESSASSTGSSVTRHSGVRAQATAIGIAGVSMRGLRVMRSTTAARGKASLTRAPSALTLSADSEARSHGEASPEKRSRVYGASSAYSSTSSVSRGSGLKAQAAGIGVTGATIRGVRFLRSSVAGQGDASIRARRILGARAGAIGYAETTADSIIIIPPRPGIAAREIIKVVRNFRPIKAESDFATIRTVAGLETISIESDFHTIRVVKNLRRPS